MNIYIVNFSKKKIGINRKVLEKIGGDGMKKLTKKFTERKIALSCRIIRICGM